jgi:thioesterase domain-containing protein
MESELIRNNMEALHREGYILLPPQEHHYAAIKDCMEKCVPLIRNFVPQKFHGDLLLFVAMQGEMKPPIEAWRPYIDGEIKVRPIDCAHGNMMEPVPAAKIGAVLATELGKHRTVFKPISKEKKRGY